MIDSPKDRRYNVIRKVLYATELPLLARLVYVVLDDHAGPKGRCWYRQQTIASKMGISIRHLQRSIVELQERGFLRVERNQKYLLYILVWNDTTPVSYQNDEIHDARVVSDTTPVSYLGSSVLIYETQKRTATSETRCTDCGDSGVLGDRGEFAACSCEAGRVWAETLRRRA